MHKPAAFTSLLAKPDPTNWDTITYTYDPGGRSIKKNVEGSYIVKYVYDGDHVIAEYDDSNPTRPRTLASVEALICQLAPYLLLALVRRTPYCPETLRARS